MVGRDTGLRLVSLLLCHPSLLNDSSPFGFFAGDIGGVGAWRARQGFGAVGGKAAADSRIVECIIERAVELGDNLARRAGGRDETIVPLSRIAGRPGLGHSRQMWK